MFCPDQTWSKHMSRTIISTQAAPAAPPSYSQAVKAAGLVFVSGTAPIDPSTGELVKGPVQAQVAQCLRNISAILTAAGSSLDKAVSGTLIVAERKTLPVPMKSGSSGFPRTHLPGKARRCRSASQI